MLGEEVITTTALLVRVDVVVVDTVVVVLVVEVLGMGVVSVLLGIKVGFWTTKVPMDGLR